MIFVIQLSHNIYNVIGYIVRIHGPKVMSQVCFRKDMGGVGKNNMDLKIILKY